MIKEVRLVAGRDKGVGVRRRGWNGQFVRSSLGPVADPQGTAGKHVQPSAGGGDEV